MSAASSRKKQRIGEDATWSPDGKQFAYESVDWDRLKFGLYLGTFGEEDAERLPYGASPAWSPDGSEIACSEPHALGARLTFINVHMEQPYR